MKAPQTLTLKEHLDPKGRGLRRWLRRGLLGVLALILLAGLLNVFGQRPETSSAATAAARLQVYAPTHVRSGLVYAARFRIDARSEIKDATLILDPGWAESYTVNGLSPQPIDEGSDNGKLTFTFGHIPQGRHLTFFLSLQVNPTNVGRRAQNVQLYDGKRRLAVIKRTIAIWP
ncbi:MAG: hypothetical protein QOH95_559 [Gaiellaceae bacterium]|jgi:hypothetical protein|nr:hypothetical protein [Gaiellaceae bacterium]